MRGHPRAHRSAHPRLSDTPHSTRKTRLYGAQTPESYLTLGQAHLNYPPSRANPDPSPRNNACARLPGGASLKDEVKLRPGGRS